MNIPIPQDIPGLITFWIFLSWIPLLRVVAFHVLERYEKMEEEQDGEFSDRMNHAINVIACCLGVIVLWGVVTFALLGFRLLVQMIWC